MDRGMLIVLVFAIAALLALAVFLFGRQWGKPLPRDLGSLDDEGWSLLKRRVVGSLAIAAAAMLLGYVLLRIV
ncbi:hypothetical protein C1878_08340 [Gordonibacter sp. 28C]|uniref:hypothetical protein n=1 Tax=Gordonibacter sp. 28C TaxID=2078569 RepID=UPI000DF7EDE1|nr:hypothetical protein [Gordonibacter sp. 28C]RDB62322.1 hypothetical protein C1878_08340 [Gordonibacter sp. 28C]